MAGPGLAWPGLAGCGRAWQGKEIKQIERRNKLATETIERILEEETQTQHLRFLIEGKTSLLMHNPTGMKTGESKTQKGKKEYIPEEEAENAAYRFPDTGDLCLPSTALRKATIKGGTGLRYEKKPARRFISGALLLNDKYFPLVDTDGNPITDYNISAERVVVQNAAVIRYRPEIETPWFLEGTFTFNPICSIELINMAMTEAGMIIGIGDWRIENNGAHGSFAVRDLEII